MFRKLSFATKLILAITFAIIIPILGAVLWLYSGWEYTLQEKTNDYLQNNANTTLSKLEKSIEYVEETGFYTSSNENIQSMLLISASETSIKNEYEEYQELRELLSSYVAVNDEIASMYVQSRNGQVYSYTKTGSPYSAKNTFLKKAMEKGNGWGSEEGITFYTQEVRKYLESGALGSLTIKVNTSVFQEIIEGIEYSDNGKVYLIDENDQIITSQLNDEVESSLPNEYKELELGSDYIYEKVMVEGESYTVYSSRGLSNGWRLVLAIPTEYYMHDVIYFQNQMLMFIAIIVILGLVVVVWISKSLTKPLKKLALEMEKVGQGDLHSYIAVNQGDEISTLNETFNQMVEDMRNLIKNEYQQQVMIKGAEMRSLQMQINPHFLYNTLDTINWIARSRGHADIGDITSSLGKLMRYALAKKEFVQLEEELNSLREYVQIQNVRYGDKVTVIFDIEENIGHYYLPKLLIQPILENAIVHGVEDKIDESTIRVIVFTVEDEIRIVVDDDGVGMTQEVLEKLLANNMDEKAGHTSIGVYNVNQRIQMAFGEAYGMQIQSILGGGTKITLRISKLDQPPQKK